MKLINENDPRCTIGIVDLDIQTGLSYHAGFRGTAKLQAQETTLVTRLLKRYMGKEWVFKI